MSRCFGLSGTQVEELLEGIREQDLRHNTPYTRDDVYQVSVSTKARHFRIVDGCRPLRLFMHKGYTAETAEAYAGIRLYTMRICIAL